MRATRHLSLINRPSNNLVLLNQDKYLPKIDLSRTEWENAIDEYFIGERAYRDREMLKDSLLDGRPYEWIAEKYAMSTRNVARTIPRLQNILFKKIK